MEEPRKYILDKFEQYLQQGFEGYCERHGIQQTPGQFITFLIDQDLISLTHLQRFTVLREFEKINKEEQFPKTLAVDTLANRFRISERTVWSILKYAKPAKK